MPGLFLKLVVAHLAGDFFLQSDRDARNKQSTTVLLKHGSIHGAVLAIVGWTETARGTGIWLALCMLLASHLLLDSITARSKLQDSQRLFVDQFLHLAAIGLLVAIMEPQAAVHVWEQVADQASRSTLWWHLAGILVVLPAGGVWVAKAVAPFRREKAEAGATDLTNRAGRMIGYCERLLIYLFILNRAEPLIGFVIAAKALMRFPEWREPGAREDAEYYLIGTLLSICWAVVAGLLIRHGLTTGS